MELVVSHYAKNMDWLANVNNSVKILIYDKSQKESKFIKLPNVGREPHTYIHHIIQNYYSLSEWTAFSQDDPSDHVLDWANIVNSDETVWESKAVMKSKGSYYFCDYGVYKCTQNELNYPMLDVWNAIFRESNFPGIINFAPACNFIIHRDTIHCKSLDFYKNVKHILETVELSPWILERYFNYIFNKDLN